MIINKIVIRCNIVIMTYYKQYKKHRNMTHFKCLSKI